MIVVREVFEHNQIEERQYDTAMVKAHPKRISVLEKSKQLEFIFKEVKQINNVSILKTLFKQLRNPVNPLEREAVDLVGDQLDEAQG